VARKFKNKIDAVYIGPAGGGHFGGASFLRDLAAASGGQFAQGDAPGLLEKQVTLLLRATA